jgi:hypothetical protein
MSMNSPPMRDVDPEAELLKERDTTQAFAQAAQDALAAEALRRDLERKSMELEDLRGHIIFTILFADE